MRLLSLQVLVLVALGAAGVRGAVTNDAPAFDEVYGVVRAHLAGASEPELNQAAVEGFLSALHGKVTLVGSASAVASNGPALASAKILEGNVAYVRLGSLNDTVASEVAQQMATWNATNALAGLVLDLRFADSEDYAAATAVAELFQTTERPLLDWGKGAMRSRENDKALRLPVTILVNRETGGAAEALAAVLRETGAGLILGNTTAGRALIGEEFPLKNGQRLRVATLPVKFGEGKELTTKGVTPDIAVPTTVADERLYLNDPYGTGGLTSSTNAAGTVVAGTTNRTSRRVRPTEADLVRARREGVNLDEEFLDARGPDPVRPLIRDAVLARAVDLIKGLAVVRAGRS